MQVKMLSKQGMGVNGHLGHCIHIDKTRCQCSAVIIDRFGSGVFVAAKDVQVLFLNIAFTLSPSVGSIVQECSISASGLLASLPFKSP